MLLPKITKNITSELAKKQSTGGTFEKSSKPKRPGIHSKKKSSVHKHGKNYLKKYRGQGK